MFKLVKGCSGCSMQTNLKKSLSPLTPSPKGRGEALVVLIIDQNNPAAGDILCNLCYCIDLNLLSLRVNSINFFFKILILRKKSSNRYSLPGLHFNNLYSYKMSD